MLTIDIGNSRVKWAQIEHDNITGHGVFSYHENDFEKKLGLALLPLESPLMQISCVAGETIKLRFIKWLKYKNYTAYKFAQTMAVQCSVINSYKNPSQMGVDRWLAMLAAYDLCKQQKKDYICIIDCGTAITFDALNSEGEHMGGLIMPGFQTMLTSLDKGTGNIGIKQYSEMGLSQTAGLASATDIAITKGCSQMISGGLAGIVGQLPVLQSTSVHCVITGGDGDWLANALPGALNKMKNVSFEYRPFLVMQGLYLSSKAK